VVLHSGCGDERYSDRARHGQAYVDAWAKDDKRRARRTAELLAEWYQLKITAPFPVASGKHIRNWEDLTAIEQELWILKWRENEGYPPYTTPCESSDDESSGEEYSDEPHDSDADGGVAAGERYPGGPPKSDKLRAQEKGLGVGYTPYTPFPVLPDYDFDEEDTDVGNKPR
jgi:hypothetical protein